MRILTGLQPSGKLHIGNYFGAMQPAIELQEKGEAFYFIADYHAMTTMKSPEALRENVEELALDFLACGLDPQKATFFCQSAVPEVHELAWILSTVCPMGLLERAHSYKDKVAKGFEASHALFAYPALMAADILLYDSECVPVGKDQKQHLEITRDLAAKMNARFGEGCCVLPEALLREEVKTVLGTDGQKMSKSYGNTIPLVGEQKPLRKCFMRILTDSTPMEAPKPTEGSLILELYQLFASEQEYRALKQRFQTPGEGYGGLKQTLFEAYWEYFAPMRQRRMALEKNRDYVREVLKKGGEAARHQAAKTLQRIRQQVGIE